MADDFASSVLNSLRIDLSEATVKTMAGATTSDPIIFEYLAHARLALGMRKLGEADKWVAKALEKGQSDPDVLLLAGELAGRRFFRGLYDKELQRVDVAAATAFARSTMDTCRVTIATQEATIRSLEQALRDQAETDWA